MFVLLLCLDRVSRPGAWRGTTPAQVETEMLRLKQTWAAKGVDVVMLNVIPPPFDTQ